MGSEEPVFCLAANRPCAWFRVQHPMCFSATASFVAGLGLLAVSAVVARRVRHRAEWPFALIPALFGIQQLIEGAIWLSLGDGALELNAVLTQAYSVFSQVLWPVYIPVAVLLLETHPRRRQLLVVLTLGGAACSLFLLVYLTRLQVGSVVQGHHITYVFPHFHELAATGLYLLGACFAPLCSSHRAVRLFGAAATLALIVTTVFYAAWFISVWCFLAAIMSATVLLQFPRRPAVLAG